MRMWKIKVATMSELKCPFCNKPLQPTLRQSDEYWCENYDCPGTNIEWVGSQKLWQELIRIRKALEIAVRAIKTIKYSKKSDAINLRHKANKALIEIYKIKGQPALEQKD